MENEDKKIEREEAETTEQATQAIKAAKKTVTAFNGQEFEITPERMERKFKEGDPVIILATGEKGVVNMFDDYLYMIKPTLKPGSLIPCQAVELLTPDEVTVAVKPKQRKEPKNKGVKKEGSVRSLLEAIEGVTSMKLADIEKIIMAKRPDVSINTIKTQLYKIKKDRGEIKKKEPKAAPEVKEPIK